MLPSAVLASVMDVFHWNIAAHTVAESRASITAFEASASGRAEGLATDARGYPADGRSNVTNSPCNSAGGFQTSVDRIDCAANASGGARHGSNDTGRSREC